MQLKFRWGQFSKDVCFFVNFRIQASKAQSLSFSARPQFFQSALQRHYALVGFSLRLDVRFSRSLEPVAGNEIKQI